jgi:hypothetical protein
MRVTVDQAGCDQRTAGIVLHGTTPQQLDRQFGAWANPGQSSAIHHQGGIVH